VFTALSFVLAVVCLIPALGKLLSHPKMLAAASHFEVPWARYRLIGVAEVAASSGALAGLASAPLGVAAASGMLLLHLGPWRERGLPGRSTDARHGDLCPNPPLEHRLRLTLASTTLANRQGLLD